jgi:SAM-dependent methyltransferase
MLRTAREVLHILACPICGGGISYQNGFLCLNADCAGASQPFPAVDGQPVFLPSKDGMVTSADVELTHGASHIDRRRGPVTQWVRRRLLDGAVNEHSRVALAKLQQLATAMNERPRILIVGGGEVGMGSDLLYDDPVIDVVSFDIYASGSTTLLGDAHHMPFQPDVFDAACIQYVLEHVLEPVRVVDELRRVLRANGLVYAVTPFLQPVHEGALDFTRFTHSGHRWLFRWFEEIESGVAMGPGSVALQTVDYLVRSIARSRAAGKLAKVLFFWLRFVERLMSEKYALDTASALYFLGRKSTCPMSEADVRTYYRGRDDRR